MTQLSNATLAQLDPQVAVPTYDRTAVTPGIVHFGVGGFHRAHQAYYLDQLMNQGKALDWGIIGAGLLPGDAAMRDALLKQDGLYTLVAKAPSGTWEPRVIGSIIGYLYGPDDPAALVFQIMDPAIRIVSLTVTEGGYNFDQVTGDFIATNPAVQAEVAGGAPTTWFGYLYAALAARRAVGAPPFTVMSCDNIQDNGAVARKALVAYAALRDPDMAAWIASEVHFPSSMVDRITPRTTPDDVTTVRERYGIEDAWPVVTEDFIQWCLTDDFPLGRPPYQDAGVQVVADVEPYELMKLRLLNASHQGLAYFAWLAGYRLVHDAARDPLIAQFLLRYMNEEATPTLRPVPGIDLPAYKLQLIERFSNAEVKDTVARLAAESSDRIPKWLIPVVRERLDQGGAVPLSAAIVASWARYAEGTDEQGQPIDIVDNAEAQVRAAARGQSLDPLAFLRQESFFGNLVERPGFVQPYLDALDSLHTKGAVETLKQFL
ncbi:MAG: mannitol dehydrogenase family protein [Bifidobacteriaceae bacterium]|jgi:mannitol 2-dehydrogenase|nr:mannitol dehydrogenase family protein [Bifidobacteriaceae bacterium]